MEILNKKSRRIDLTSLDAGGKMPPQAIEIEEAVLGACMIEKTAFDRATLLKPEHFYLDAHQYIFEVYRELSQASKPIDILSVTDKLKSKGHLDIIGGPYKIAQLTSKVSSAANIEYHCAIIYQKFGMRELIRIAGQLLTNAYDDSNDLFELQRDAANQLDSIIISDDKDSVDLLTAVRKRTDEIAEIQKNKITTTGIATGWPKIDNILHGWQKSDLVIVAARPGQGKSALACNIAVNVARQNIPVGMFSLEMNISQLVDRIISSETGIGGEYLKKANLTDAEWNIISSTKFSYPLYLDDSPNSSLSVLRSKIRRMYKKHGVKMIIVDYLQLMQDREEKGNRQQEVGRISRGLKLLAKELSIPIIALAQLSREAEGSEPQLNHLREAGDIEQDADVVIFPYNKLAHDTKIESPIIDLIIAKHRHGPTGIRVMQFKKATQQFIEYNG